VRCSGDDGTQSGTWVLAGFEWIWQVDRSPKEEVIVMTDYTAARTVKQVALTSGDRSSLFFLQNQDAPLGAHC